MSNNLPISETIPSETSESKDPKHENEKDNNYPKIILSRPLRWIIFTVLASISTLSSLDGGVISAASSKIKIIMNINDTYFGIFGSIDYLGRILGSLLFVGIINKLNRKYILIGTLISKAFTWFIPLYIEDFYINSLGRAISGFSQVYYTIYLPVWCDQYGPKKGKTIMISTVQLGTPLGIVIGFGLCTLLKPVNWQIALAIEGIVLAVLGVILLFFPNIYFSSTLVLVEGKKIEGKHEIHQYNDQSPPLIDNEKSPIPSSLFKEKVQKRKKNKPTIWNNLKDILSEKVFVFTGLANSVVFFGMAAIQYWVSDYMLNVLNIKDDHTRFLGFAVVCTTGPPAGVIFGGILGSLIGGYTHKKTILFCILFSIIATTFATVIGECDKLLYFAIVLWTYFFFSGAMIPLETGIIIASIPERLRGDGFSLMNFVLNLFGNLPAPFVYGFISNLTKDQHPRRAMCFSMYYTATNWVFIWIATFFRLKKPDDWDEIRNEGNDEKNLFSKNDAIDNLNQKEIGSNIAKAFGAYGNPDQIIEPVAKDENDDNENNEETNGKMMKDNSVNYNNEEQSSNTEGENEKNIAY